MTFDALKFAEESARTAFGRLDAGVVTHWRHPDFLTKAACGRTVIGQDRWGNPLTCPDCQKQKDAWEADDERTAQSLGLR